MAHMIIEDYSEMENGGFSIEEQNKTIFCFKKIFHFLEVSTISNLKSSFIINNSWHAYVYGGGSNVDVII